MLKSLNKRYMKDIDTDILTDGERYFVVDEHHWDGEKYFDCFEVAENLIDIIDGNVRYNIKPDSYEIWR